MTRPLVLATLILLPLGGCTWTTDVRSHLLESARSQDPNFPDGQHLQLAQFAYIGKVDTPDGKVYVASRRVVIAGLSAPRWLSSIDFFDSDYRLLRSYCGADLPMPLWCEGAKVYLWGFGRVPDVPVAPDVLALFPAERDATGNVLDLTEGFGKMVLRREKAYGSSGGTRDDPFAAATEDH